MESTSTQPTCSLHPTVQAQEPGQGVQRPQEEPQAEEHHHHHHPQKHLVAAVPTDHPLKEESEEEQLVAWDLSLTDFTLQRDIILTQWTTFMMNFYWVQLTTNNGITR